MAVGRVLKVGGIRMENMYVLGLDIPVDDMIVVGCLDPHAHLDGNADRLFKRQPCLFPFNGETTVAIAIKHIQEELPSPKEFVPEIPGSVESIVIKCCQKSPDRRYQNMQDLVAVPGRYSGRIPSHWK
mgnify:CR=1 FL=1